jgi:uncharacterized protein (TIGR02246 family)
MTRAMVLGCLGALLVTPPAQVAPAGADPASAAADAKAVETWLSRYSSAMNGGDLEAFGRLWAKGADWAPPDAPLLSGQEAILESARALFQKYAVTHRFTGQRFRLGEGFGVAVVAAEERHSPKTGRGPAWEQNIKGVILLRRDDDGAWRGTHFIWNRDAPATH